VTEKIYEPDVEELAQSEATSLINVGRGSPGSSIAASVLSIGPSWMRTFAASMFDGSSFSLPSMNPLRRTSSRPYV
jgi:hypothetical protein